MMTDVSTCSLRNVHSPSVDVAALLRRVIEGDQRAWDDLVDGFGGLVWSVARGYRLGPLTDDVVQTVWLRLAENCGRIREPDRLAAWLATTTRNEALRVANKQKRLVSVGDIPEHVDATVSGIDEIVADSDALGHVLQAFKKLSDTDQQLLRLLCAVPPLDYATIADLLERPIGSIGPSRERCLKRLRRLLGTGFHDATGARVQRKDESE